MQPSRWRVSFRQRSSPMWKGFGMESGKSDELRLVAQLSLCIGGCGAMVLLMYCVYNYPSPSGQAPAMWSFVAFFFREFLFLGFIAVAIVAGFVLWLSEIVRRIWTSLF